MDICNLRAYQYLTAILVIGVSFNALVVKVEPGEYYNPNNWASMSISFGAAVLTLVGIITSIMTSSENSIRNDVNKKMNDILMEIERKENENPDKTYLTIYQDAKKKIHIFMKLLYPMKYKVGLLGVISFYTFCISVLSAIIGWKFKMTHTTFFLGFTFMIGYISYCVEEFIKIDSRNSCLDMEGKIDLMAFRINGVALDYKKDENGTINITYTNNLINRVDFKILFNGKLRNGFLHVIIRYKNNQASHIPDSNTNLMHIGFVNDYFLTKYGGEDTGVLHIDKKINLSMDIPLRTEKGTVENPFIGYFNHPNFGNLKVYKYCSLPDDFLVDVIEIRIIGDPYYRPNYERRVVNMIKVNIIR